jgi:hypothetical protein
VNFIGLTRPAFLISRRLGRDELFLISKKPFSELDATVLKPLPGIDYPNDAPKRRIQGAQTKLVSK